MGMNIINCLMHSYACMMCFSLGFTMPVKLYYPAATGPALLVLLQTAVVYFGSAQAATSAETCEAQVTNPTWNRMEVLPGAGWDNLRNLGMDLVFEYDYTQCQLTNDRKYLLPDGFFAIPVQESDVETFSELIAHWENHTSLTSNSINLAPSYFSKIDGNYHAKRGFGFNSCSD